MMETFGPYQLGPMIGRGGMGEVYKAVDTRVPRDVAVKRLKPGFSEDDEYRKRFKLESRSAARLLSPHIIPVFETDEIDGRLYIAMALVNGVDLRVELGRVGPLSAQRACNIVSQIADALDDAHESGLIHRDVKPSNILITQHRGRDFIYLVDFGVVRAVSTDSGSSLTGTGLTVGTLPYMAPELFLNEKPDIRVDVYALGCLLYECLTGRPPFSGEGAAVIAQHLHEAPPLPTAARPDLPAALNEVVGRAMAKSRDNRYDSAGALADAALRALEKGRDSGKEPVAPPLPPNPPTPPPPLVDQSRVRESEKPTNLRQTPPRGGGSWPPPPPNSYPPLPGYDHPLPVAGGEPKTSYAKVFTPMALSLAGLAVLGLIVLVIIEVAAGPSTSKTPEAQPSSSSTAATSPSKPAPPPNLLAQVFPDVNTQPQNCNPLDPQTQPYIALTGEKPVAIEQCQYYYPSVTPVGQVLYLQWPNAQSARSGYTNLTQGHPDVEGVRAWGNPGDDNPIQTLRTAAGGIETIGIYDGKSFMFLIDAPTTQGVDTVFNQMDLSKRNADIPG